MHAPCHCSGNSVHNSLCNDANEEVPHQRLWLSCHIAPLLMFQGLEVRVWRDYDKFIAELTKRFPHEAAGIRKFYDECWRVRLDIDTVHSHAV